MTDNKTAQKALDYLTDEAKANIDSQYPSNEPRYERKRENELHHFKNAELKIRQVLSTQSDQQRVMEEMKVALEWSGTVIKFNCRPESCVSRNGKVKSSLDTYKLIKSSLASYAKIRGE